MSNCYLRYRYISIRYSAGDRMREKERETNRFVSFEQNLFKLIKREPPCGTVIAIILNHLIKRSYCIIKKRHKSRRIMLLILLELNLFHVKIYCFLFY